MKQTDLCESGKSLSLAQKGYSLFGGELEHNRLVNQQFQTVRREKLEHGSIFLMPSGRGNRYETKLPWKSNPEELDCNFETVTRRFDNLKIKLDKNKDICEEYKRIIDKQLKNGIVEECSDNSLFSGYFMPHQAVIRPEKETSRVRIVFDASSKGKNSKSLNDLLFSEPNLIPDLLHIILTFRKYEIAFCSDIEKAFLNISIAQEDSKYLKFLWFDIKNNEDFKVMNMQRLPFGFTSSPFILTATIKNHLKIYININPECVNMLNSSLYVDDLFYGTDTVNNAYRITSDAVDILKHASMNLCKFNSNSQELKDMWLSNNTAVSSSLAPAKILGLNWNTDEDFIKIETSALEQCIKHIKNITKRSVLQLVAKIYDPTGFISPFIMNFKILLQKIWMK
ncbi:transposable element Tcb2 transposase [Trichonephila clavata]|uniref:Transposable element Tcb2 transposase n=1 Tax=Trichonephila clavata TaxID=2740835 RepID=A0A8X6IUG1_TRICU|nr:transposable element Tcb2 transposase [Trichonephila clavata]